MDDLLVLQVEQGLGRGVQDVPELPLGEPLAGLLLLLDDALQVVVEVLVEQLDLPEVRAELLLQE